ncbi:MAG: hypothetical protein Q9209_001698 [Squamulea sp. 1 TL-2023]
MTDFNPFEESLAFWDQSELSSVLDDFATSGATPSSSSTYTAPQESTIPDHLDVADPVGPQGVHFNVSQRVDDTPVRFDNLPDILQDDDFWNNIENGPSLADFETASPASHFVDTSYGLESKKPLHPLLGAFQTPQLAISPPQVPLTMPPTITPSGGPQHSNLHTQSSAPTKVMYQSPYLVEWLAVNQFVYQEPDTAVSSEMRGRKRKAREYDDSDEDSMNIPTSKRRKSKNLNQMNPGKVMTKQRLHIRMEAIERFDGSKIYDPLPFPPTNWSIFRYTSNGELEPGTFYTTAEIKYYLYNHPLYTLSNGIKSRKQELWHLNTEDFCTDPFHNAGYVHLNCLERHLDFPQLCHDLPIMIDDREMPYEPKSRNLMSLSSQHLPNARLSELASEFLEACNDESLIGYPRGARPHEGTFVSRLMRAKIMTSSTRKLVEERGLKGSHAAYHLGDLEVESATRNLTRRPEYQRRRRIDTRLMA